MSADARVGTFIQRVREIGAERDTYYDLSVWADTYMAAVDTLIAEAKDALRLTDHDINRY